LNPRCGRVVVKPALGVATPYTKVLQNVALYWRFLARGVAGDEESLLAVVGEIAGIPADDGVTFDASSARVSVIREHTTYSGLRVSVPATLGTARLQLRLDVNFGDPVGPQEIEYPTLLSDKPIDLLGYPVESVITEKVETMISHGDSNTRERDYVDVLALSKVHPVEKPAGYDKPSNRRPPTRVLRNSCHWHRPSTRSPPPDSGTGGRSSTALSRYHYA
jgi:hypothetical protein